MTRWLDMLPLCQIGATCTVKFGFGGQRKQVIQSVTDHFIFLESGSYALKDGRHVLGDRTIIAVQAQTENEKRVVSAREKLIRDLTKKLKQQHKEENE